MQPTFFVPDAVARRRLLIGGVSATACALLPSLVHAQDKYPSRPIEFVVPWGPGAARTSWRGVSANWWRLI